MITLVSAFKKPNVFGQSMTWCDCFPKPLNLASMSTICPSLTILSSYKYINQPIFTCFNFFCLIVLQLHFSSSSTFLSVYLPPLKTGTMRCSPFPFPLFISKFIHRASVSKPGAPFSPAAATQLSAAHTRTPLSIDIVPSRVSLCFVMQKYI